MLFHIGTEMDRETVMYNIERAERKNGPVMKQNCDGGVEYLTFPLLEDTGIVRHLFTTRLGGVSEGIYATMNLSYQRGDDPEHVLENYKRVGAILGASPEKMVASRQTHTTNIRLVTDRDCGKGVVCPTDYEDVDGLITGEKGIALVTSYADCVPLYFVDRKREVIGLAHSGWRGTVQQMGARMVEALKEQFGTMPEDIYAAIGPSICQECYEVSGDVAGEFEKLERDNREILTQIQESGCLGGSGRIVIPGRQPDKYQLDLWLANLVILVRAGVLLKQIAITDICTCHNPEYLFSHRASNGKRGNLCAFLMLKEEE